MDWMSIGHSLWLIVGLGLVIGAGLPAVFALGLRALSPPAARVTVDGRTVSTEAGAVRPGPVRRLLAGLCFAVVLGAVGYGIVYVATGGH